MAEEQPQHLNSEENKLTAHCRLATEKSQRFQGGAKKRKRMKAVPTPVI